MIPAMNIVAWGNVAPWAEQRQIEQDLIISRAIVEIFNDPFLAAELRSTSPMGSPCSRNWSRRA